MDEDHFEGQFSPEADLPPEAAEALCCPFPGMDRQKYAWVVGVLYQAPHSDPEDVGITREEMSHYGSQHIVGATWYKDHDYSNRIGSIQRFWYQPSSGKLYVGVLVNNDTPERQAIVSDLRAGRLRHMSIGILKKKKEEEKRAQESGCRSHKSVLEGSFTNDPKIPRCDILYCHSRSSVPQSMSSSSDDDIMARMASIIEAGKEENEDSPQAAESSSESKAEVSTTTEQAPAAAKTEADKEAKLRAKAAALTSSELAAASPKRHKGDPAYLLEKRKAALASGKKPSEVGGGSSEEQATLIEKVVAALGGGKASPALMAQLLRDPDAVSRLTEEKEREHENLRKLVAASNAKYAGKRDKEALEFMAMLEQDGIFSRQDHERELRAFHSSYTNRANASVNRVIQHFATTARQVRSELKSLQQQNKELRKENAMKAKTEARMMKLIASHIDVRPSLQSVVQNGSLPKPQAATILAHSRSSGGTALDSFFHACPDPSSSGSETQPQLGKRKLEEEVEKEQTGPDPTAFNSVSDLLGTERYQDYRGATGESASRTAHLINRANQSGNNMTLRHMMQQRAENGNVDPFYDRKLKKKRNSYIRTLSNKNI